MALDNFALRCFITVAETRNVTKSAEIVGRTQSAVSQQITRLETLLDKELFDRDRNMSLTESGKVFMLYARKINSLQREALLHVQSDKISKEIHIGFPDDLGYDFINRVYNEFTNKNPHTSLIMTSDYAYNLFDRFNNKEFDLCIVKELKLKTHIKPVFYVEDELVWIGNGQKIFYNVKPLVLSPYPSVIRSRTLALLEKHALKNKVVYSTNNFTSKISAIRDGLGIGVIPAKHVYNLDGIEIINYLPKLGNIYISVYSHLEGAILKDLYESIKKYIITPEFSSFITVQ